MKTKELIRLLQEADPTGEAHVRMSGGIPTSVQHLPGYYDGSYSYFDEEGRYVISKEGSKVDIYTTDIDDFIWDLVDFDTTWEEVKAKIVLKIGDPNIDWIKERHDSIYKNAMQQFADAQELDIKYLNESTELAVKRAKEGWQFYQNKKVDTEGMYTYYMWKIYSPDGKTESSSVHDTQGIIKSGLFRKVDCDLADYYKWELI